MNALIRMYAGRGEREDCMCGKRRDIETKKDVDDMQSRYSTFTVILS